MATVTELEVALEAAVQRQFSELFTVLCLASDPAEALKRFEKGLQKLLDSEAAVSEIIHQAEAET